MHWGKAWGEKIFRKTAYKYPSFSHLSAGVRPQVGGEAEGLVDGEVGLHDEHGGAGGLRLLEHVAATPVEHSVDTTHGVLGTLGGEE